MEDDAELTVLLKQARTSRERAALLGVDYRAITQTSWRLRGLTSAILVVYLISAFFIAWIVLSAGAGSTIDVLLVDLLAGTVHAAIVAIVSLVVCSVSIQLLAKSAIEPLRQQFIAVSLQCVTSTLGLLFFVATVPSEELGTLMVFFPVFTAAMGLIGVQQLPLAITLNDRNLQTIVRATRAIPAELSLLGGRARWLTLYFGLTLLEATGIMLLIVTVPVAVIAIVPLQVAAAIGVIRAAWASGASAGLPIAAAGAAVFLIAGVTAAAIS